MRQSSAPVCLVIVVLGLLGAFGLMAMAQDAAPLAFDVASVKPGLQVSMSRGTQVVPGRFTFTDLPLAGLIARAYGVPSWKITNAPDWVRTEPFTVQAIFPPSTTPAQMNAMLRTLLEQRFRLSVQMETSEMDTDVLIPAHDDRRLGRGMHPVNVDCESQQLREGSAPGLFPPDKRPRCAAVLIRGTFSSADPTSFRASSRRYAAVTLTDLANALSGSRGRPVLDRTGLSGQFDVELDYASQPPRPAALDPGAVGSSPDSGPSLSVALEEQLGLKLRRERNQVEIMMIRSVERPRAEEN